MKMLSLANNTARIFQQAAFLTLTGDLAKNGGEDGRVNGQVLYREDTRLK